MMKLIQVWCIIQAIIVVQSSYSPQLSWDVCSPSKIVVTLTGAADGGIIYIRGYGAACRQTTSSVNQTSHEFDFQACGIITGETYFTIVVQKSPLYQTGSDLQESLLCIYDLSDITIGNNGLIGDKTDDAGINKTVKPTGYMMLYKDGVNIGGQNVKLSDLVTMTIQLDDEFVEDFDIKAMSCTANFIETVVNFCSEDTALFPNFDQATQGMITSTFGAFRTTDLGGGFVEMIFSCTVQVCRGPCDPEPCANGEEGWGRKRRAVGDVKYDELNIGASFSIGNDNEQVQSGSDNTNSTCINNTLFILVLLALIGVIVTSLSLTVHVTTKLLKRNDELRNLTGIKINTRQRKSLINVVRDQRRQSIPLSSRYIDLTLGHSKHSLKTEEKTNLNIHINPTGTIQRHSADKLGNVLETKNGFGVSILSESQTSNESQICVGKSNLLNVHSKDAVRDSAYETRTPTRKSSTQYQANVTTAGNVTLLQNPTFHNSTAEKTMSQPVQVPSISGKVGGQAESMLESLLGLDPFKLGSMTGAEKKSKLMECQALLNRFKSTQLASNPRIMPS